MAGGTWLGIETSRRGIKVHQNALDITGQNLANASTPGYSRQEAVISASKPYTSPELNSSSTPGQFGTGVQVDMIRRIKDEYLDNNVRRATTDSGYWEDQISVLQRAEALFAEPGTDGISTQIVDFFKTWMDLNNSPQDLGVKSAVTESGSALATLMTSTYNQLDSIEQSVAVINGAGTDVTEGMMVDQVNQINKILTEIKDITAAIKKIYDVNQQPNDLLDKRDQLLEELSHYGPVKVTDESSGGKPTGGLKVDFFNQTVFEDDAGSATVILETLDLDASAGKILLYLDTAKTAAKMINLTDEVQVNQNTSGSLLGLESSRLDLIDYQTKLNDIAIRLRDEIAAPAALNGVFFVAGSSLASGTFKVDPALTNNPSTLDGTKASAVAALRDKDIAALGNSTFNEYYSLLVTEVGNGAQSTDDMAANQAAIKKQITALRDSVSGVSTDEELTKMTQFQYGFQASSRMITVIDDMLNVIINRMGV